MSLRVKRLIGSGCVLRKVSSFLLFKEPFLIGYLSYKATHSHYISPDNTEVYLS